MKPVKLTIDDKCDYVSAGKVLNQISQYLSAEDDFKDTLEVFVDADIYDVKIDSQETQVKVYIKTKKTFDEVFDTSLDNINISKK